MINISSIANRIASDWESPTSKRDAWRRKLPNGKFEYRYTDPNKKSPKTIQPLKIPEIVETKIREEETRIYSDDIEHLIFMDNNGNKVIELKGEKDYCPFDGHQSDLKDKWVTHNHPGGTSFSWQDLYLMKKYGAKGMRITSKKYDYQVVFDPNSSITEEDIKHQHFYADTEVRTAMYKRLSNNEITIPEANAIHSHLVWLIVSKKLGFTYERTEHK